MDIQAIATQCKDAAILMSALSTDIKDKALKNIIKALETNMDLIIDANKNDLEQARKDNLDAPLLKRLKFDQPKISEACDGIASLIKLEDPVGKTLSATELDKGLTLFKVSRPIGVIGVIFESRPDALVQIAALCLKSGNAVLLKGGSEASATNQILASVISKAGVDTGLPEGWLGLLETRSDVDQMLKLEKYVDLIIPRGSNEFVRYIMDNTVIPVLGHADGICHLYIDRLADPKMAVDLSVDSKCQYVAVCNATETILVHEALAKDILPVLKKELEAKGVKIYGCEKTGDIIDVEAATEKDWQTEYLDLIVSIKVVPSLKEAVAHINRYGSGHTDVIVTSDKKRALYFMDHTDTADAFWNCSSRFSDGFRFGLGAEVGISTNKIHARGPVGLEGLMIYQWRMIGDGHMVKDYTGEAAKPFTHKSLNKDF
ncbi:glutamate-5-semialdehyde dehydrogenase [Desulfobacula toluolica]|uniref:Gamma-glutamyl phosphate reductase n=1 Tax=Desulfobacula toluolica (strain DSM 7467 / Tol2) TaxID=651182 RepID=K0NGL8_DESTT|nr:glutamate-5-semialdehyde dehydrogenase [Desulfobacula toluolica]CCK80065.1 ProA: gamma-glutamyl phosphate reductase (glutamate-5-semialdehyde dehydrogenase) [Desulfobacula toluolica Tol2]